MSELVHTWNPDFVITLGDNSYGPIIDDDIGLYYHRYIHPYIGRHGKGAAENRFFPSLGNHDWDGGLQRYTDYLMLPGNERYYSFTAGAVEFFAVDSDYREPDGISPQSIQGQWLMNELAESNACWQVVYFHAPPYSSGSLHGPAEWMRWPFAAWGADAVLAGHEHLYERLSVDGIPYIVNGLGGTSIYKFGNPLPETQARYNDSHGALMVTATETELAFEFRSTAGVAVDEWTETGGCEG